LKVLGPKKDAESKAQSGGGLKKESQMKTITAKRGRRKRPVLLVPVNILAGSWGGTPKG